MGNIIASIIGIIFLIGFLFFFIKMLRSAWNNNLMGWFFLILVLPLFGSIFFYFFKHITIGPKQTDQVFDNVKRDDVSL
jgi:uncharacterized membrane protein YiaA